MPRVNLAVDRMRLRASLGLPHRIPPDFQQTFRRVGLQSSSGTPLGTFAVTVLPSSKPMLGRMRHRVMVLCDCGDLIPAGRLHQHVCKTAWECDRCRREAITKGHPTPYPEGWRYSRPTWHSPDGLGVLLCNKCLAEELVYANVL